MSLFNGSANGQRPRLGKKREATSTPTPDVDLLDDGPVPILELRGVRAGYDGIDVVHGIDLSVTAGKVMAILGPNGAGKSTTLKVVAGLLPASSGDLLIAGRRVNGARPDDLARRGLCLIPEGRGIFPNLTVRENLWMVTHGGGRHLDAVLERSVERFPPLAPLMAQTAGTLSGGQQQML
ncbi:MAG TPA: ATP-binding cassette domain-containing protein, partial [Iamia sp.]|nr:ATP-binding cassette domain-containing protein [Iamia sp.]